MDQGLLCHMEVDAVSPPGLDGWTRAHTFTSKVNPTRGQLDTGRVGCLTGIKDTPGLVRKENWSIPVTFFLQICKMWALMSSLPGRCEDVTLHVSAWPGAWRLEVHNRHSVVLTLCDPMDCSLPLLCPWHSPGKNIAVGCHFLFQGIFLIQRSNAHVLHWQAGSTTTEPPGKSTQNTDLSLRFGGSRKSSSIKVLSPTDLHG